MPGDDVQRQPWLVIDPAVAYAVLVALLRREGGQLTIGMSEILDTSGVTWSVEGYRSPEDPGNVRLRLRRLA